MRCVAAVSDIDMSPIRPANAPTAKPRFSSFFQKGPVRAYSSVLARQAVEFVRNFRKSLTPKTVFLIIVAFAVIILFGRHLKDIILVAVLGLMASYSTIYKRTIRVPSAVELVTLGTVITGAAYGPGIGAAFGVFTTIASEIISSGVDVNTVFYAIARGIAGGLAQTMVVSLGWSVVVAGMAALVIWHVVCDAIYVVSGGVEAVPKIVYFVVVNTLFNFLVFTFFGNLLLKFAML